MSASLTGIIPAMQIATVFFCEPFYVLYRSISRENRFLCRAIFRLPILSSHMGSYDALLQGSGAVDSLRDSSKFTGNFPFPVDAGQCHGGSYSGRDEGA
jgi:hypothetical protein